MLLSTMESYLLIFSSFLLLAQGARIARQADDCSTPPENADSVSCCEPPRHIWGNIRGTIHSCAMKVGFDGGPPQPEGPAGGHYHGPAKRHYIRHRFHDGCFVECLFQGEGFLTDNKVNKQALLDRLQVSLADEPEWKATTEAAVEKCTSSELEIAANETCVSGSAETLKCIFRQMFMECPFWLDGDEYCTSLKSFYQRCPDGPPPQTFPRRRYQHYHDHHHHHHHHHPRP
ncbi:UNVERIFIED_CONTAM: hypothetical protein PYX00_003682 [Menopon gallinae]|uniref:Uncharacterized protein n=1 Tax=Menopon gallinae TaxID=328185 RepID=A0AAW2I3H2_9NEOP